jgi:nucleoside-diphosphate-sugar epimerase
MNPRYLITGAQGLVGRHLTAQILAADRTAIVLGIGRSPRNDDYFTHHVVVAGKTRRAPLSAALRTVLRNGRYRYRSLPLRETNALRSLVADFAPHYVFHVASALHSASPIELAETNVDGMASLLSALDGCGARLVVTSTAGVYGNPSRVPVDEDHPCVPVNAYGSTKLAAERLTREHFRDFVIARIFNVVGAGQPDDHICGRLATQVARASDGTTATIEVGPLEPTRDFVDVRDIAAALLLLSERAPAGAVVNVGSGLEVSIGEVLSLLVRVAKVEVRIVGREDVPAGVARSVADIARLRLLGFQPAYRLERSLRDSLEWWRQLTAPRPDSESIAHGGV